ncbi:MAG: hypothetical protein JST86_04915 [Bacteroidetes bacterium]|nr:hypothetical protein [Bacteroidota bacterium]
MKTLKFWGILSGISAAATIFGAWAKLTHQSFADTMLNIAMPATAVCQGVYWYFKFTALGKKKES